MYLILTMILGLLLASFGLFNFVRALLAHDSLISQITPVRFIISGVLLICHQPLTTYISGKASSFFEQNDIELSETIVFWIAVLVLVAIQCVVLPSWRILLTTSAIDAIKGR